jgi:GPH family glycoside/pentoside/hexuronide:cation symporter
VALAAFVALSVLELSGFSATIDNAEPALFTLSALYLLAPSVFSIVAAALIWNYPVTSERHQRIRARLEKRNLAREKAASALPD